MYFSQILILISFLYPKILDQSDELEIFVTPKIIETPINQTEVQKQIEIRMTSEKKLLNKTPIKKEKEIKQVIDG